MKGKRNSQTGIGTLYLFWLTRTEDFQDFQDITSKLNKCKAQTFRKKNSAKIQHSEGYKRRSPRKKLVVREVNRKKHPERKASLIIWRCICYDGIETVTAVEGNINCAIKIE